MSNINPIKFGVAGNHYFKQETNEDLSKPESQPKAEEGEHKQYKSEEVLGFMAAQNADFIAVSKPKTVNISDYVNAEQEARIAEFMKNFEADFDEASDIAFNEFPDISQETADNIALAYINATY